MGDLNSRVGNLEDYILNDEHDVVTKNKSYVVDNFTKNRTSLDLIVNDYGKSLIDTCISHNLAIVNGRCTGDNTGNFTCITANGSSVVDYYIISKNIFDMVNHMKINTLTPWSDHKQIEMSLKCHMITNNCKKTETMVDVPARYIWDDDSKCRFLTALREQSIQTEIDTYISISYENSKIEVNKAETDLCAILHNTAKLSLKRRKIKLHRRNRPTPHQQWFNDDCFQVKKQVQYVRSMYNKYPKDRKIKECFDQCKNIYKSVLKKIQKNI